MRQGASRPEQAGWAAGAGLCGASRLLTWPGAWRERACWEPSQMQGPEPRLEFRAVLRIPAAAQAKDGGRGRSGATIPGKSRPRPEPSCAQECDLGELREAPWERSCRRGEELVF